MTDSKKPVESASAAPGEKRAAAAPRLRAAESGDPEVHKALADLQSARMNLAGVREAQDAKADEYEADEKAALDRLAELGYGE
jgi:hypothetical protein